MSVHVCGEGWGAGGGDGRGRRGSLPPPSAFSSPHVMVMTMITRRRRRATTTTTMMFSATTLGERIAHASCSRRTHRSATLTPHAHDSWRTHRSRLGRGFFVHNNCLVLEAISGQWRKNAFNSLLRLSTFKCPRSSSALQRKSSVPPPNPAPTIA